MADFENLNYSYDQGIAPAIIQFHERTFLENIKRDAIHLKDAQQRFLPEGNGDSVKFRRLSPFEPTTEPLKEGVTPAGQKLTMSTLIAKVKPYGRHIEYTDEMDWKTLNQLQRETAKELAEQGTLSIDAVARNAMHAGLNVQYANGKANRAALAATDVLTAAEIKKAVRTLERNHTKKFADGYYHAIVSPDTKYDLTNDPLWIDVAKYQNKEAVEQYELGKMMGVKFYESPESKVFEAANYLFGTTANVALTALDKDNAVVNATATAFGANQADQIHNARTIIGTLVDLIAGDTTYPVCIEDINFEGTVAKIKLRWVPTGYNAHVSGAKLAPTGGGASGVTVQSTLIYGQNFHGTVALQGGGKNVRIIPKRPGSSGAADPLDQRGTIAWKVKGFCAVILQDAFGVRIEHGATA